MHDSRPKCSCAPRAAVTAARPLRLAVAVTVLLCGGMLGVLARADPPGKPAVASSLPKDWESKYPTARVVGVVQAATGGPVSGATVCLDASFWAMGEHRRNLDTETIPFTKTVIGEWKRRRVSDSPHVVFTVGTDADGRFVFLGSAALYEVVESGPLKVWAVYGNQMSIPVEVSYGSKPTRVQDLRIVGAWRPRVLVSTGDGKPVPGAYVRLDLARSAGGQGGEEDDFAVGGSCDDSGSVVLPRVPSGGGWLATILVRAEGFPCHFERPGAIDPRNATLRISIGRGATIRGRVVRTRQRSGEDVVVCARGDLDGDPDWSHAGMTGSDGTFEVVGVPVGEVTLLFTDVRLSGRAAPDGASYTSSNPSARLTMHVVTHEAEVVSVGTIEVPDTSAISGTVWDSSGKRATHGWVLLDGVGRNTPLSEDGGFTIEGVEIGKHDLEVTVFEGPAVDEGALVTTVRGVEAGRRDVQIRVSGGGNLVLRFHPPGRLAEALVLSWPWISGNPHTISGSIHHLYDGDVSEMRTACEPGIHRGVFVGGKGVRTKALGDVQVLADRVTVLDVEMERE